MSLQRNSMLDQVAPAYKTLQVDDDDNGTVVALELYQQNVEVRLTSTNTVTITLPPVKEAEGLTFTIRAITDGGGVTIQDQDDSAEWSDLTTDADGEYVTLYSSGTQWVTQATDIS